MIVNRVQLPPLPNDVARPSIQRLRPGLWQVESLLTLGECGHLLSSLDVCRWEPVSIHGMKHDYRAGDRVGSTRVTSHSQELADRMWSRLQLLLPRHRDFTAADSTDHRDWASAKPVGVNALHRFIRYAPGGQLVAHYDGPYDVSPTQRTLQSMVVYLDNDMNLTGGRTRFLHDPQSHVRVSDRNLEDWPRVAKTKEVDLALRPTPGSALIFDHRLLHDGEPVSGEGRKTLLRTDIVWEQT